MDFELIERIKRHKPGSTEEMFRMGFGLVEVGSGVTRTAYQIHGSNLVIKFERKQPYIQTINEVLAIEKINSAPELAKLRPYVMELYHGDINKGVVLTKYYKVARPDDSRALESIEKMLRNHGIDDLFWANFGRDNDRWVAIDLGHCWTLLG